MYDFLPVDIVPVDAADSTIEYVVATSANAILVNRLDRIAQPWIELQTPETSIDEAGPPAPQLGTSNELDTGYDDIYAATMQRGLIYATRVLVHAADDHEGNGRRHTAVSWAVLNPEAGIGLRHGILDDPSGNVFYAYPSLAVNHSGAMVVAFSTFSSTSLPSAGYLFIDAAGRTSLAAPVKNGEAPILDTNRWGDYATTVVDPLNGRDFWTLQMYATAENTWGTWWAKIAVPAGKRRPARK
jgi:hypothetical protein